MATKQETSSGRFKYSVESVLADDSRHNLMKGDLGFGLGLKPGAVSTVLDKRGSGDAQFSRTPLVIGEEHNYKARRHSAPQVDIGEEKQNIQTFYGHHTRTGFLSGLRNFMLSSAALRHLIADNGSGDKENGLWTQKHQNNLFTQLEAATQEVSVLQSELEAARRQLDSKYRAIKIIQSQAIIINKEKTKSLQQAGDMKKSLEQEVNSLQFDLSTSKECAMFSQQTWAERFDRVCLENETLVATLRARSEQVRQTQLEKKALMRQRDELLAMMDAKERLQYDRHKSSTNDAYLHNSLAQQFGVLGACLCRGSKPEPCGCARAAARLKKENDLLKDEVDELRQNLEAVTLMADSFRTAFDKQLDQNAQLGQQISRVCQDKKSSGWKKSNHRRKKEVSVNGATVTDSENSYRSRSGTTDDCLESEQLSTSHRDTASRSVAVQVVDEPVPELISALADMLNDKTEALAHQRLVAKMLARKTQDLERTMEQLMNEYNKR